MIDALLSLGTFSLNLFQTAGNSLATPPSRKCSVDSLSQYIHLVAITL
ncbi:hypothetical protein HNP99_001083 [Flavobacterium sp. 28A]|nr:hypothetical protein [Flavobacterium sp. 28A]